MSERVILVRHGETAWSLDRRHTGRTDMPLTEEGRRRAAALAPMLAAMPGVATARVQSSPLRRARETAALAGLADRVETNEDLREWDYGDFEGLRTADIREAMPGWSVWTHEITGGERLADVGHRADRVIEGLGDGLTLLFAHAHFLRILAARWCGLEPTVGQVLTIDPGGVSVLGYEREARVIERWNLLAGSPIEPS